MTNERRILLDPSSKEWMGLCAIIGGEVVNIGTAEIILNVFDVCSCVDNKN